MQAEDIIRLLDLQALPMEGGYYRETLRATENIKKEALRHPYKSDRSLYTCIYYLITPDTFSSLHKLPTDEVFHFYLGDPVEMLQLHEDGTATHIRIGNDLMHGEQPQVRVPAYTWQGSKLAAGGRFALLGTSMAPGFEFEDFIAPDADELLDRYPRHRKEIENLL